MLFRTKFIAAVMALAGVAIICATLLIVSTQRGAFNQVRANLAHENLSGYFQLYGALFQTFKQARRDLLSDAGVFAFDFARSGARIQEVLDHIESTTRAEADLLGAGRKDDALVQLAMLRAEVAQALDGIHEASGLMASGQTDIGRQRVVAVLEESVDIRITTLIDKAIVVERAELAQAQAEIRSFQELATKVAWIAALVAVVLSAGFLITLLRRFRAGLRALETGANAYGANDLDHVIELPGKDELSAIAKRFTAMAQRLMVKQQALESARQDLEQRVAERTAELSVANNLLREQDSLRRQFFADIGHELRTPVTAIRGEAEVALRARADRQSAQEAALKTIVSLSEELTGSVSDLFLIARGQAGVLDFRTAELDLVHATERGVE